MVMATPMPTTEGNVPGVGYTPAGSSALYRLLSWLSPSYPIGAFSYSHGLETAVEAGFVKNLNSLKEWLRDIVEHGAARNDALFLKAAYEASLIRDDDALADLADLALAFQPSSELALETTSQGQAFLDTTLAAWPCATLERFRQVQQVRHAPLPVVVGCAVAGHGIPLEPTLHGYLHGFVVNLASAAMRLIPLGQTDGQHAIAAMEPVVAETVSQVIVLDPPLDHLATTTFIVDWCSMRHETQYTRLFRS